VTVVLGSHRVPIQCRHNPYSYPFFIWSHRSSAPVSCLTVPRANRVFDESVLEHEGRLSAQMHRPISLHVSTQIYRSSHRARFGCSMWLTYLELKCSGTQRRLWQNTTATMNSLKQLRPNALPAAGSPHSLDLRRSLSTFLSLLNRHPSPWRCLRRARFLLRQEARHPPSSVCAPRRSGNRSDWDLTHRRSAPSCSRRSLRHFPWPSRTNLRPHGSQLTCRLGPSQAQSGQLRTKVRSRIGRQRGARHSQMMISSGCPSELFGYEHLR